MKLLLDQNLSYRIIKPLTEIYPGSAQVGMLRMGRATDREIWQYARQNGYSIVTMDANLFNAKQKCPP